MQQESRRVRGHLDIPVLLMTYGLAIFGVLCIAIATFDPDKGTDLSLLNYIVNSNSGSWQAIFCMVSPVVLSVVITVPYEIYKARAQILYYMVLVLLVIVLGASSVAGINAWLKVGLDRTIQPCEFAKLTLILVMARTMNKQQKPMNTLEDFVRMCLIFGVPAAITMLQGEMGSVIVMAFIFITMIYFGGVSNKVFFGIIGFAALAIGGLFAYFIVNGSDNYRVLRILSFLDPKKYELSGGYQILKSQMAIGSGGTTGIGMFVVGSISQLDYVPEHHTDFIFSVIGESFGFVGCLAVVLVYLALILRLLYLARYTYDKYGQLVIIGVMAMLLMHVFENIAMTLGLMPITGIPLPFLSYGGSNLITNIIGIGLALNAVKNRSNLVGSMPQVSMRSSRRKIIFR